MALPATDSFNRADENPIAGNWTTLSGMGNLYLVSNTCSVQSVGNDGAAYWNADAFGNDQYSQAVVAALATDTQRCVGPAVRMAAGASTMYSVRILGPAGATATVQIFKRVAGANTQLTSATKTVAATDLVKLQVVGTTLTFYVNGVQQATTTDASIASGSAGLSIFTDTGTQTDVELDTWEGGNVSSGITAAQEAGIWAAAASSGVIGRVDA